MSSLTTPLQISLQISLFCKFRCVTANSEVNKTTVQTLRSNRTQFNEQHTALVHVLILKECSSENSYKIFETQEFFMFFVIRHWETCFKGFWWIADDESFGIEMCKSLECHFLNYVWRNFYCYLIEPCNRVGWLVKKVKWNWLYSNCPKIFFDSITLQLAQVFLTS
jgi:hypothetical protein